MGLDATEAPINEQAEHFLVYLPLKAGGREWGDSLPSRVMHRYKTYFIISVYQLTLIKYILSYERLEEENKTGFIMATSLWGKIYYNDLFAGELRQEPGGRCVFTYDPTYLRAGHPSVAFTLPRQAAPHICEQGLHPFFDNLVAEGWLRNAQARALKVDPNNRFALLLAFGRDCAGVVGITDPDPDDDPAVDLGDPTAAAALASRSSLSGVQPKLLAVQEGKR